MKRQILTFLFVSVFGFLFGYFILEYPQAQVDFNTITVYPEWINSAESIEELVSDADKIVYVRVLEVNDTRLVEHKNYIPTGKIIDDATQLNLPVASNPYEEDTDINYSHPLNVGIPFTESIVEVIETYKGEPSKTIVVSQTGGDIDVIEDSRVQRVRVEFAGDPLLNENEELVLFLMDIGNGPRKTDLNQMYMTLNPNGRFAIMDNGSLIGNGSQTLLLDTLKRQIETLIDDKP